MGSVLPTPRLGPSPFLEGTAVMFSWDSTSLGAFKRCPRLYQLSIIEGWTSRDQSFHLTFGILYTEALDTYYKIRADKGVEFDHDEALKEIVGAVMEKTWITWYECTAEDHCKANANEDCISCTKHSEPWETGDSRKNRFSLIRTIVWYLDQFGPNDPAETLVDEDGQALSERSFRFELDWGPRYKSKIVDEEVVMYDTPYILCGHLDRVVSFLDGHFVMDHKTTKSQLGEYYFDQYEPNNQMSLYTIAGQLIFQSPMRGVIIDAAYIPIDAPREPAKFKPFARGVTYRTPAQLEEWLRDLRYWLDQAEHYATDGYWPMNDTACFGCQFNQHGSKICAKDPSVRPQFLKSNFTQENPWNPLRTR